MSEGCRLCENGRSCGNFHLYVIELDKEKALHPDVNFPFDGELQHGKSVYYVGMTAHTIECRYKQHVKKTRKNFICTCFTDEPKRRELKKRGEFTEYHLPSGLRPLLTVEHNPVVMVPPKTKRGERKALRAQAVILEEKLAKRLRKDKHAVHQN